MRPAHSRRRLRFCALKRRPGACRQPPQPGTLPRGALRVARQGIFVTTPNRWFPVEFHTLLPLLHWLPVHLYRKILDGVGMSFFAQEKNLNLLSRSSFVRVAEEALIEQFRIESVSFLGLPTNLLLIARKGA